MMPDMNGYEVLEHVKADAALRDVPDHHDFGAQRNRQRYPLHRAWRGGLSQQAVQPDLLRARVGALLEKKSLRDEVRASLARLEQEMEAARKLQMGMLPRIFRLIRRSNRLTYTPRWSRRGKSAAIFTTASMPPRNFLLFGRRCLRQRRAGGDVHGAHPQPGAYGDRALAPGGQRSDNARRASPKPSIASFARTTKTECS